MIRYLRRRQQLALSGAVLAVFLFGCFVFGVLSVRDSTMGLVLIGTMFCVIVYWARPEGMIWVALFYGFAALPLGLNIGKVVGPVTIFAWHMLVLLAIGYLISPVRLRSSDYLLPIMFALTVMFFAGVGFAIGHAADAILHEVTSLFEMIAGFLLAQLIVAGGYIAGATRAIVVTLWFSAAMAVMSSAGGLRLTGRLERIDGASSGGTARLIISTTAPALAVLCALVAAAIIGRVRPMAYLSLGLPAMIISLLSFSRGILIATAVAAVVAFLSSMGWPALWRAAKLVVSTAAILAVTLPAALFLLQQSAAGAWLDNQITGFSTRVLGGVSGDALAADESTHYRLEENAELLRGIAQAPVFGHGLGYPYRLAFGNQPAGNDLFGFERFTAMLGTTYAHNFYLWWLVKSGAVGMSAFAALALTPVIRALRCGTAPAKISAAVSVGLLVLAIVGPNIEDSPDALTFGMALGSAMAFASLRRKDPGDGTYDGVGAVPDAGLSAGRSGPRGAVEPPTLGMSM